MSQVTLAMASTSRIATARDASLRFFFLDLRMMVGMPDSSNTRRTTSQNTDAKNL
jgi:hypothetical protein